MAKAVSKDTQPATVLRQFGATLVATVLTAVCWVIPIGIAAKVNLDTVGHQGTTWAAVGILTVVLGAVSIHNALHEQGVAKRLLYVALALIFLAINFSNALANLSAHSEGLRDSKRAEKSDVATLQERLSQLSQSCKEQVAVAGNATPDSIDAEIQAAKAADAPRWKATDGCNVEKITAGPSKAFCATIAQLQAKKAAAIRRDELDAIAAPLNEQLSHKHAPESLDSFADTVAEMLTLAGYKVDDNGKKLIAVLRDWSRAGGLELIGEFGPSILLSLLTFLQQHAHRQPVQPAQKPAKIAAVPAKTLVAPAEASEAKEPAEAKSISGDGEIDAFIAQCVDFVAGSFVPATPLYTAWQAWCEPHGIDAGTQTAFSKRVKARIAREPNNGRPRYIGIALRTADTRRLRVVSA